MSLVRSPTAVADPLVLVRLAPLTGRTAGRREISVGLLDGPAAEGVLARDPVCLGPGADGATEHGSFVAAMLSAARAGVAPAICPGCTLLVRPIFVGDDGYRSAPPEELAAGIVECVEAGASVLNLSAALIDATPQQARVIRDALDLAMARGVLVVAAAGNQGRAGGATTVTSHPWVISVTAFADNPGSEVFNAASGEFGAKAGSIKGRASRRFASFSMSLCSARTDVATMRGLDVRQ